MFTINNMQKIWFIWAMATVIGWGTIGYFGFENRNLILSSWHIVFQALFNLLLNGLMIGGTIGLLQFLFLSKNLSLKKSWIFLQACIYALGSVLGILIIIVLTWVRVPNLFTQSQIILPVPVSLMMLVGGSVIGLLQVLVLRNQFEVRLSEGMLYLLLSSFAWGLSFFLSSILGGKVVYIENIIAGTTIGTVTGFAIIILIRAKEQINISQLKR